MSAAASTGRKDGPRRPVSGLTGKETLQDARKMEYRASTLEAAGNDMESLQLMETALQIRCREIGPVPTSPELLAEACDAAERVVMKCNVLGVKSFKEGKYDVAVALFGYATEMTGEGSFPLRKDDERRRRLLGVTLNNYGCMERHRGHFSDALDYMQRSMLCTGQQSPVAFLNISAVQMQLRLCEEAAHSAVCAIQSLGPNPEDPSLLAVAHHNLAMALELIDPQRAREEYRLALSLAHSTVGRNSDVTKTIEANMQRFVQVLHGCRPGNTALSMTPPRASGTCALFVSPRCSSGGGSPVARGSAGSTQWMDIFPHPFAVSAKCTLTEGNHKPSVRQSVARSPSTTAAGAAVPGVKSKPPAPRHSVKRGEGDRGSDFHDVAAKGNNDTKSFVVASSVNRLPLISRGSRVSVPEPSAPAGRHRGSGAIERSNTLGKSTESTSGKVGGVRSMSARSPSVMTGSVFRHETPGQHSASASVGKGVGAAGSGAAHTKLNAKGGTTRSDFRLSTRGPTKPNISLTQPSIQPSAMSAMATGVTRTNPACASRMSNPRRADSTVPEPAPSPRSDRLSPNAHTGGSKGSPPVANTSRPTAKSADVHTGLVKRPTSALLVPGAPPLGGQDATSAHNKQDTKASSSARERTLPHRTDRLSPNAHTGGSKVSPPVANTSRPTAKSADVHTGLVKRPTSALLVPGAPPLGGQDATSARNKQDTKTSSSVREYTSPTRSTPQKVVPRDNVVGKPYSATMVHDGSTSRGQYGGVSRNVSEQKLSNERLKDSFSSGKPVRTKAPPHSVSKEKQPWPSAPRPIPTGSTVPALSIDAPSRRIQGLAPGANLVTYVADRLDMLLFDEEDLLRKEGFIITIQRAYRASRARRLFDAIKAKSVRDRVLDGVRRSIAARKIQRIFRKHLSIRAGSSTRYRSREVLANEVNRAAVRIQCCARQWRARRRAARRRFLRENASVAAFRLQTWWRSVMATRKVEKLRLMNRCHRDEVSERERYEVAATVVQSLWRARRAGRQTREERLMAARLREKQLEVRCLSAARMIQTTWRLYVARKELNRMREVRAAREERLREHRRRCDAARRLQAFGRRIIMSRKAGPLLTVARENAAKRIRDYCLQYQAASKIQRAYRLHWSKCLLERMKKEHTKRLFWSRCSAFATTVQRIGRAYFVRRSLGHSLYEMAVEVQDFVRRELDLEKAQRLLRQTHGSDNFHHSSGTRRETTDVYVVPHSSPDKVADDRLYSASARETHDVLPGTEVSLASHVSIPHQSPLPAGDGGTERLPANASWVSTLLNRSKQVQCPAGMGEPRNDTGAAREVAILHQREEVKRASSETDGALGMEMICSREGVSIHRECQRHEALALLEERTELSSLKAHARCLTHEGEPLQCLESVEPSIVRAELEVREPVAESLKGGDEHSAGARVEPQGLREGAPCHGAAKNDEPLKLTRVVKQSSLGAALAGEREKWRQVRKDEIQFYNNCCDSRLKANEYRLQKIAEAETIEEVRTLIPRPPLTRHRQGGLRRIYPESSVSLQSLQRERVLHAEELNKLRDQAALTITRIARGHLGRTRYRSLRQLFADYLSCRVAKDRSDSPDLVYKELHRCSQLVLDGSEQFRRVRRVNIVLAFLRARGSAMHVNSRVVSGAFVQSVSQARLERAPEMGCAVEVLNAFVRIILSKKELATRRAAAASSRRAEELLEALDVVNGLALIFRAKQMRRARKGAIEAHIQQQDAALTALKDTHSVIESFLLCAAAKMEVKRRKRNVLERRRLGAACEKIIPFVQTCIARLEVARRRARVEERRRLSAACEKIIPSIQMYLARREVARRRAHVAERRQLSAACEKIIPFVQTCIARLEVARRRAHVAERRNQGAACEKIIPFVQTCIARLEVARRRARVEERRRLSAACEKIIPSIQMYLARREVARRRAHVAERRNQGAACEKIIPFVQMCIARLEVARRRARVEERRRLSAACEKIIPSIQMYLARREVARRRAHVADRRNQGAAREKIIPFMQMCVAKRKVARLRARVEEKRVTDSETECLLDDAAMKVQRAFRSYRARLSVRERLDAKERYWGSIQAQDEEIAAGVAAIAGEFPEGSDLWASLGRYYKQVAALRRGPTDGHGDGINQCIVIIQRHVRGWASQKFVQALRSDR